MITLNFKAIFIAVVTSLLAQGAALAAELYFGWNPTNTVAMLMSVVVLWIYMDLDAERRVTKAQRERIGTALDKLDAATRKGIR